MLFSQKVSFFAIKIFKKITTEKLSSLFSQDIKDESNHKRLKRASHRGQTQSQYLSFGNDDDGKAEAEATHVTFSLQSNDFINKTSIRFLDWLACDCL